MNYLILFLIGCFSGVISGMGIGGGTILIPALNIFLGYEQKLAQSINLLYFIPTAVIALITHSKNKNIEKKGIVWIIGFGLLGAIIGSMVVGGMDNSILRRLFGGFLIVMGLSEIFKKKSKKEEAEVKNA